MVQKLFVPANRVIHFRIHYSYCILPYLILTELILGCQDASRTVAATNSSSQHLAGPHSGGLVLLMSLHTIFERHLLLGY